MSALPSLSTPGSPPAAADPDTPEAMLNAAHALNSLSLFAKVRTARTRDALANVVARIDEIQ